MCALESQYVTNEDDVTKGGRRIIVDVDRDSYGEGGSDSRCIKTF